MRSIKYKTAKQKNKIHAEAMKRWDEATSREKWSRQYSMEDKVFNSAHGGQWADVFSSFRDGGLQSGVTNDDGTDQRPRFEINLGGPVISQLVGEQRRTDIGPEIKPEGQNADKGTAETLQGLIRNIEQISNARDAYDNSYNETLQGGYGAFEVATRFINDDISDDAFNQEIVIEPIDDATSSVYFGPSKKYTKEDAPWAFKAFNMDMDVFKATYPDAKLSDFGDFANLIDGNEDWFNAKENTIRLAVYWRKKSVKKTIVQLSDGRIEELKDIEPVLDELAQPRIDPVTQQQIPGITIVNQRSVQGFKLEKFLLNGAEILDQTTDYKGKFIPIIPEYGERINIAGAEIVHGKIRFSKDPARILNFTVSAITERAALGPAEFFWMTPGQMAGHETDLGQMNTSRKPVHQYNSVDENGEPLPESAFGPPKKSEGGTVQAALINLNTEMRQSIFAVMGTSGQTVSDGTAIDPRSGEAIKAAAVSQDTGSFVYLDNLHKSVQHCYRVITDLAPHVYDTERQQRIIKPDDTAEMVFLNQEMVDDESGETVIVNDLSMGKFGVSVRTGPAFATQRQEAADGLIRLTENDPELRATANDIIVENMDGPGMDEMAKRLKENKFRTGILVPSPEEAQELGLDRDQLIIQQARPQIEAEVLQGAQAQREQATTNALNAQAAKDQSVAQMNAQKGEAELIKSQATLVKAGMEARQAEADIDNTNMDTISTAVNTRKTYLEGLVIQAQQLGIPLTIIEHDNRIQMEDLVELTSFVVDPDLNSNQVAGDQQARNLEELIQRRQFEQGTQQRSNLIGLNG